VVLNRGVLRPDESMRVRDWAPSAILTFLYAVVVVWTALHHEPWRDEVMPLSIARSARTLRDLAAPLKTQAHPILWYLVLWVGYGLVGQTWILKVASLASAIGAIFLFSRSPLPWWLRSVFVFSFFPLYQYSVVSRGYSLEMLLLFGFCSLYSHRHRHPLALALVLVALANTEALGLIMAVAAAVMLVADGLMKATDWRAVVSDRWVQAAAVVYLVGLSLAVVVTTPDPAHTLTGLRSLELASIVASVGRAIAQPVAHAARFAILPIPSSSGVFLPAPAVFVWAYFVYLARNPPVLCFTAISLVGIEVLFNAVYGPGAPWHAGNQVLVLVAAMWLDASTSDGHRSDGWWLECARTWLGRVLTVAMTAVLAGQMLLAVSYINTDLHYDYSSNRRLAELLESDPTLAGAVVMGEPDTPLWSLSYYAGNRTYLARDEKFGAWSSFLPPRHMTYDLGALLNSARRVHDECGCPVVITFGLDLAQPGTQTNFAGTIIEEKFVITPEARAEFLAATTLLAQLRGPTMTDERYDVYVLR
jgi:hypothetical protein